MLDGEQQQVLDVLTRNGQFDDNAPELHERALQEMYREGKEIGGEWLYRFVVEANGESGHVCIATALF